MPGRQAIYWASSRRSTLCDGADRRRRVCKEAACRQAPAVMPCHFYRPIFACGHRRSCFLLMVPRTTLMRGAASIMAISTYFAKSLFINCHAAAHDTAARMMVGQEA